MRRFGIILIAAGLTLAMALPVDAKKPTPPEPLVSATYTAEITFTGVEGIDTTCGDLVLTRTDTQGGRVVHFESTGAELNLAANLPALDDGCHGSVIVPPDPEPEDYVAMPEYFRITLDGDRVAMLWIFDVAIEVTTEIIELKNGKFRVIESDTRTDYRMGGPYEDGEFARWSIIEDDRGVITINEAPDDDPVQFAQFAFVHYDSAGHDVAGSPIFVALENSPRDFALTITLTPEA